MAQGARHLLPYALSLNKLHKPNRKENYTNKELLTQNTYTHSAASLRLAKRTLVLNILIKLSLKATQHALTAQMFFSIFTRQDT